MNQASLDRVFGTSRLRMLTGPYVEVYREASEPGARRRYTKRFLSTRDGDFRQWTEREWRILARLVGHGARHVPDVVQYDRGAAGGQPLVQTYDAGVTVDHWVTLLPVQRDGRAQRHVFEDCAHWWALARHLLLALHEIHALQLVHLDLKADNICLPYAPPSFQPTPALQRLYPVFEDIALIDFAFALVSGEVLTSPLPIGWQRALPYQSPRLLHALTAGQHGDLEPTRRLDWRCDMFSLDALLGGLLPGVGDAAAADRARCGWTDDHLAAAQALRRDIRASHDAEPAERLPHPALAQACAQRLLEPDLADSLALGWALVDDGDGAPPGHPGQPTAPLPTAVTLIEPERAGIATSVEPDRGVAATLIDLDRVPSVPVTEILPLGPEGAAAADRTGDAGRAGDAGGGAGGIGLRLDLGSGNGGNGFDGGGGAREGTDLDGAGGGGGPAAAAPPVAAPIVPPPAASGAETGAAASPGPAAAARPGAGFADDTRPVVEPVAASAMAPAAGAAAGTVAAATAVAEGVPPAPSPPATPPDADTRSVVPPPSSALDADVMARLYRVAVWTLAPLALATVLMLFWSRSSPPEGNPGSADRRVAAGAPRVDGAAGGRTAAGRGDGREAASGSPATGAAGASAAASVATADDAAAAASVGVVDTAAAVESAAAASAAAASAAAAGAAATATPTTAPVLARLRTPPAPTAPQAMLAKAPAAPFAPLGLPAIPLPSALPAVATAAAPPVPTAAAPPVPTAAPRSDATAGAPPDAAAAPPPVATAAPRSDPDDRLARRAGQVVAQRLPRVLWSATPRVARALAAAGTADDDGGDRRAMAAAAAIGDRAFGDADAWTNGDPAAARRLNTAARQAFWQRGDAAQAFALQWQAFGAQPNDAEIAGNLAFYALKTRPRQTELARQLAIYALATATRGGGASRLEDWGNLAVASALSGRREDAVNAMHMLATVTRDGNRSCRSALSSVASFGPAMKAPAEALLSRVRARGLADGAPNCDWPPRWAPDTAPR